MKELEWIKRLNDERKNMSLKEWLGKEEICSVTDLDYSIKKRAISGDEFAKIELLNMAVNEGILSGAESGDPDSQYEMGVLYLNFIGNEDNALKWFERAAAQGHKKAALRVVEIYYNVTEAPECVYDIAFKYLQMAIPEEPLAYLYLGEIYNSGGVDHNAEQAIYCYSKAAQNCKGVFRKKALEALAFCYLNADEPFKDIKKAKAMFSALGRRINE